MIDEGTLLLDSHKSRMRVLRDMVIFVEVGRRENFTQAARALGMPLSTIARRISTLEEELGMLLIERTTRSHRLTEDGRRYFERCKHVVDDAFAAYDDVHSQSHGLHGTIRIAVPAEVASRFLAETVAAFLSENEGIGASIDIANNGVATNDDTDLLVRVGEPVGMSTVARKVGMIPIALYASPSYLGKHAPVGSRNELRSHEILVTSEFSSYCATLMRYVSKENLNFSGRMKCDTLSFVASLAASGKGIVALPIDIASQYVDDRRLVRVLDTWNPGALPIFAVMKSRLLPARIRSFVTFLTKRFWLEYNPRLEVFDYNRESQPTTLDEAHSRSQTSN